MGTSEADDQIAIMDLRAVLVCALAASALSAPTWTQQLQQATTSSPTDCSGPGPATTTNCACSGCTDAWKIIGVGKQVNTAQVPAPNRPNVTIAHESLTYPPAHFARTAEECAEACRSAGYHANGTLICRLSLWNAKDGESNKCLLYSQQTFRQSGNVQSGNANQFTCYKPGYC